MAIDLMLVRNQQSTHGMKDCIIKSACSTTPKLFLQQYQSLFVSSASFLYFYAYNNVAFFVG